MKNSGFFTSTGAFLSKLHDDIMYIESPFFLRLRLCSASLSLLLCYSWRQALYVIFSCNDPCLKSAPLYLLLQRTSQRKKKKSTETGKDRKTPAWGSAPFFRRKEPNRSTMQTKTSKEETHGTLGFIRSTGCSPRFCLTSGFHPFQQKKRELNSPSGKQIFSARASISGVFRF